MRAYCDDEHTVIDNGTQMDGLLTVRARARDNVDAPRVFHLDRFTTSLRIIGILLRARSLIFRSNLT